MPLNKETLYWTTTVHLQGWLWHYITQEDWYAIKIKKLYITLLFTYKDGFWDYITQEGWYAIKIKKLYIVALLFTYNDCFGII